MALFRQGQPWPLGTLLSNLLGCLVMGALLQWLAEADWFRDTALANEHYRLLFAVGFCGSFTTLSALVYETSVLFHASLGLQAAGYLATSVVGGFASFWLGVAAVRLLMPPG
ncbi:MAG: CrcB family protein [Woeseiaceae bacterium]|nr:CrcB family protein [Woeseiaceae bacterium]